MTKIGTSLTLNINDFSSGLNGEKGENIAKMSTAISSYNFNFNKGILTEGMGVGDFLIPTQTLDDSSTSNIHYDDFDYDIKCLGWYSGYSEMHNAWKDRLVLLASNNYVWYIALNDPYPTTTQIKAEYTEKFKSYNLKIDGEDRVVFANKANGVMTWSAQVPPSACSNCPIIVSLCEYKNKLYFITGSDSKTIRYTEEYDIRMWSDTLNQVANEGEIEINDGKGKLNRLINFQNYLYVIRDYNILKLTQYSDKNATITWTNVYNSNAMIYADTVQVCGDDLIMLTRDGLITFDGVNAKKLETGFDTLIKNVDNKNAISAYHGGKYYLACKAKFDDQNIVGSENLTGAINNVLLCFDPLDKSYAICRGVDICDMVSITADCLNKLVCCFNVGNSKKIAEVTNDGKFFDDNSSKFWCSPLSDLGYSNKKKIVKEISLLSKYDCEITVFTEKEEKTFHVIGSELLSKFPVRISGKQIGFKIETISDKAYISNVNLQIDVIDCGNLI